MIDKQQLKNEISKWSDEQFDGGRFSPERSIPISYHLKKEVDELIESLENYWQNPNEFNREKLLEEFADCNILLDDCSTHVGFSAQLIHDAQWKKLEKNKNRDWGEPDENGVVEHKK